MACRDLGYDADFIAQFLEAGEYPQELLDKVGTTAGKIERSTASEEIKFEK